MTAVQEDKNTLIGRKILQAFDDLTGYRPGFRATHAKGILLTGTFRPSAAAGLLSNAPHLRRSSTPVTVRFSNFTGIPAIPDNSPEASPRGMAVRFHLAEHTHTDIVAHSVNGFPARTAEEFIAFLNAARDADSMRQHLATHPAAMAFIQTPKPQPASFANESFYAVSSYGFSTKSDQGRTVVEFGRYRICPVNAYDESGYLEPSAAAQQGPDYLFEEIRERLANGPVKFRIIVQVAGPGDVVDDATVQWSGDRSQVEFGIVQLDSVAPDNEAEQRHIIFDPLPRVEGIAPSTDPLLQPRADCYLMSGRRRRAAF